MTNSGPGYPVFSDPVQSTDGGVCVNQPTVPVLPPISGPAPTITFTGPRVLILV